jgi:uncharacterized repeat protein (TIGR01451 family)
MKWFVAAALILLVSLAFQLGLLAYAMYALLAVLIVSRMLTQAWVGSLHAVRECNRLVAEIGDTAAVIVTIENRGRLPVPWVVAEDLLPRGALVHTPPQLRVTGRRMEIATLWRQSRKSLLYQLQCNRRGYYQLGPLVLETGDLLGLHRRYRILTEPHFLMVYPKVIPLEGYDITSNRPIGEVRMSYRLYEDPTRIAGVRQYQPGDPLNRVHWRATARTGTLHSKVYEPSTVAGATLLLDFHQVSYAARDEPFRSELAITASASVANAVYEMGQQIGLVTNGRDAADRIRQEGWGYDIRSRTAARNAAGMLDRSGRLQPSIVPTQRGPEQLLRILTTLARLELTDGLGLPQLVSETTSRLPRDATVIALFPVVTVEAAITLDNLRRRGFSVAAIVNTYEEYDFAQAAGMLLAHGIDAHHLLDEASIVSICHRILIR